MQTELSASSMISHGAEAISHEVSNGVTVILDLSNGMYYRLDAVGTRVWNLIGERSRTIEELVHAVTDSHEVEAERCRREIFAFLGEMATADLIQIGDSKPG